MTQFNNINNSRNTMVVIGRMEQFNFSNQILMEGVAS
jgi:hypothetical protein